MARILGKLFIYLVLFLSFPSFAHGQAVNYVPGEVIVKLKGSQPAVSGSGSVNRNAVPSEQTARAFVSKAQSGKGLRLKSAFSRMGVYHFNVRPGQKVEDAVSELATDPDVEYAEPNYIFAKATVGSINQSFSVDEIQAMAQANSGSYMATGAPIEVTNSWGIVNHNSVPVVAIIDTGLDLTHSVFRSVAQGGTGAVWRNSGEIAGNGVDDDGNGFKDDVNGWNFVSNSGNMIDDDGHGTHVAGIVLGVTQDIYHSPYPAAYIRIMPLKFLDGSGYGKTSDAIRAIYYAVNNGATVINNSWGGPSYSSALHEAIAYAYDAGVIFVAAAGNNGANNDSSPMYPASYKVPNLISVAATTDTDAFAYFSNYGRSTVHLASPGVFILSTLPGGYGSMSGTSMAAPFVSGLAALMKVQKPGLLGYQAKQIVLDNIDVITDAGGHPTLVNKVQTEGRMNVYATIQSTKAAAIDSSQPDYNVSSADRGVASAAAGGCGVVSKMILEKGRGGPGSGGAAPESWGVLFVIALFALPMIVYNILRKKDPKQRREYERFKINSEVKVMVGEKEMIGSISTISLGGVQLNTDAMIEKGGVVTMMIRSPDGQEQIAVEGRVVWSEAQKAYGVQFAQTTQGIREKITGWTKALAKAS